jgi:cytochrome c-type biogenesis protein CcmE
VARSGSPARLIIALSVAGVLAVFLVYVAVAGNGMPQVQPSELNGRTKEVVLTGRVVAGSSAPLVNEGVRFRLSDVDGGTSVPVVYRDSPPDQFKGGRDLSLHGQLRHGVFVGVPGTMVTKCPSKYSASRQAEKR